MVDCARRSHIVLAVLALGVLVLTSGCVSTGQIPSRVPLAPGEVTEATWELYFKALAAAMYPSRSEISKDLQPILPDAEGLVWKDGRVLMVTWTRAEYFADPAYSPGYVYPLYGDTWFTTFPSVRNFCTVYRGDDLGLRLRQKYGLPPEDSKDAFLEVWVRPEDLLRPCPDPEIADSQCQVRIPLADHKPPPPDGRQPPWYCPSEGEQPRQVAGAFQTVHQAHLNWMCQNWISSYTNDDPAKNYPWTALGYTYDWGRPKSPEGLSEYVSLKGASVIFERLVPTDAYCGR